MSAVCPTGELTMCHWDCGTVLPACHQPATWVLTTACVHEHVIAGGMCDQHKAQIEADPTPWTCSRCWSNGFGHDCESTLVFQQVETAQR